MKSAALFAIVFVVCAPARARCDTASDLQAKIATVDAAIVEKEHVLTREQKAAQDAKLKMEQLEAKRAATEERLAQERLAAAQAEERALIEQKRIELADTFGPEATRILLGTDEYVEESWRQAEDEFKKNQ